MWNRYLIFLNKYTIEICILNEDTCAHLYFKSQSLEMDPNNKIEIYFS